MSGVYRCPPNEIAPRLLTEVIEHRDENGGLANATGDDLRDALALAAERIRRQDVTIQGLVRALTS